MEDPHNTILRGEVAPGTSIEVAEVHLLVRLLYQYYFLPLITYPPE